VHAAQTEKIARISPDHYTDCHYKTYNYSCTLQYLHILRSPLAFLLCNAEEPGLNLCRVDRLQSVNCFVVSSASSGK